MPNLKPDVFGLTKRFPSEFQLLLEKIRNSGKESGKFSISLAQRSTLVEYLEINLNGELCLNILSNVYGERFTVLKLQPRELEFAGQEVESLKIRHEQADSSYSVSYEIKRAKKKPSSCTTQ